MHRTNGWLSYCIVLLVVSAGRVNAQHPDTARYFPVLRSLVREGLGSNGAYALLQELVAKAPHRLSGSAGEQRAVALTTEMMKRLGFEGVRQETVMVPHWDRGRREEAFVAGRRPYTLAICALGGSVATPPAGVTAEVVEVRDFGELQALGERVRGKIVFFNRPMDPTLVSSFSAYAGAVNQRSRGAVEAARAGGVATLVRSMTHRYDRVPHTGSTGYADSVTRIPAAAISTVDADSLSILLRRDPRLMLRMALDCRTLPEVPSANVLGELRGTEKPGEIIVVGGHLDCWDKGHGAHDDGAGCMQALEVLRLLKACGVQPKRTIRAVMFMNEENGNRGGRGYAAAPGRKTERHIGAIESDAGGFAPRGFTVDADSSIVRKVSGWAPLFAPIEADRIGPGGGGVDISPIVRTGVPGFGLRVDTQRYFDYHHSANDTIETVNPRELELGAIAEALLCLLLSEEEL